MALRFVFKVLILFAVFTAIIFIFSGIYSAYDEFFLTYDTPRKSIRYDEALWLSVSTQTLLGQGDISPMSTALRAWVGVQSFLTFALILFIAGLGIQNSE